MRKDPRYFEIVSRARGVGVGLVLNLCIDVEPIDMLQAVEKLPTFGEEPQG